MGQWSALHSGVGHWYEQQSGVGPVWTQSWFGLNPGDPPQLYLGMSLDNIWVRQGSRLQPAVEHESRLHHEVGQGSRLLPEGTRM